MSSCYIILGVPPTASRTQIRTAYRAACRRTHPDTGGKAEDFIAVTNAYHQALLLLDQPQHDYLYTPPTYTPPTYTPPPQGSHQQPQQPDTQPTSAQPKTRPLHTTFTKAKSAFRRTKSAFSTAGCWLSKVPLPQSIRILLAVTAAITLFMFQRMLVASPDDLTNGPLLLQWSNEHSLGLPLMADAAIWLFALVFGMLAFSRLIRMHWFYTIAYTSALAYIAIGQIQFGLFMVLLTVAAWRVARWCTKPAVL